MHTERSFPESKDIGEPVWKSCCFSENLFAASISNAATASRLHFSRGVSRTTRSTGRERWKSADVYNREISPQAHRTEDVLMMTLCTWSQHPCCTVPEDCFSGNQHRVAEERYEQREKTDSHEIYIERKPELLEGSGSGPTEKFAWEELPQFAGDSHVPSDKRINLWFEHGDGR